MIQIEILSNLDGKVRALFYFPVPLELRQREAQDKSRRPLGTRLGPTELEAIQAGWLLEVVHLKSFASDASIETIQARLLTEWAALQAKALADYSKRFTSAGLAYIDGRWQ